MASDNASNSSGKKPAIRVAHIAGGLTSGGVEGVVYNYFSALQDRRDDYDLVYISYDTPDPEVQKRFEAIGFTVYSVTKKRENLLKSNREVAAIFKTHNINIVHSHMTLMCFVTSFIGWRHGVRLRIAHAHLAQTPKGLKRVVYALCKWLTRRTSNHWFACGREAGSYVFGKNALAKGRVTIINNAVPPERYLFSAAARARIRTQYGIGERFCVGHLGRFTEQKNHNFLVDAFAEMHRKNPDTALFLLGTGPLMNSVRQKVEALGLNDAVVFAGGVDNAGECYSAMDMMIFPSLYEGLAVALVEAQYAGLPVIVSDTVTDEIDITGSLQYLPLEAGTAHWAQQALALEVLPTPRVDAAELMALAGYDIGLEAGKLDAFYRKEIKTDLKGF